MDQVKKEIEKVCGDCANFNTTAHASARVGQCRIAVERSHMMPTKMSSQICHYPASFESRAREYATDRELVKEKLLETS